MIHYLNEMRRGDGCGCQTCCCPSAIIGPQGPQGPQGEVGPQGPIGPQGPVGPVATGEVLALSGVACQPVPTSESLNLGAVVTTSGTAITFTAPNTITLNQAGLYAVTYNGTACDPTQTEIGLAVAQNDVPIPSATTEFTKAVDTTATVSVATVITAAAGDTITVINPTSATVNYGNSSVTVVKLA